MSQGNIPHQKPEPSISDIAYLARSHHRIPALIALTERPRSRSELCELTGVSSSTIRRTLDEFDSRIWIRKDGYRYTSTRLGEVIASGMEELIERIETARKLRDVWHWLPDEVSEYPLETWEAMTVTVAEPDAPYRPVNRFESLLQETNDFRFIRPAIALMEPCFDVLHERIEAGVNVVLVDRSQSHSYFLSTYLERSSAMMQQDNFTVLEHNDLPPCGIGFLDDCVVISCYDQESGTVQALIETDVDPVRKWAQSVFETYTVESHPVERP